jgi:hypothetical protein
MGYPLARDTKTGKLLHFIRQINQRARTSKHENAARLRITGALRRFSDQPASLCFFSRQEKVADPSSSKKRGQFEVKLKINA